MKPVSLDEKFAEELTERYPTDHSWLVAVSGGKDSMALLHFLERAGYRDLTVCHLNHQLRGVEADKDADLVEKTAKLLGCVHFQKSCDIETLARRSGSSLETAARNARYAFLAEVAAETGVDRIFLAHHADDQVETVLMNFFRGAGPTGLSGMKSESVRECDGTKLQLLRPFLGVFRSEIDRYVEENEIEFREDESNRDDFALRNRVRWQLLPKITEVFGRDTRLSLLRTAALMQQQEQSKDEARPEIDFRQKSLSVELLRMLPEDWRNEIILGWLRFQEVPDCGFEEVRKVSEIVLSDSTPAKTNLPAGIHARRKGGVLFLKKPV